MENSKKKILDLPAQSKSTVMSAQKVKGITERSRKRGDILKFRINWKLQWRAKVWKHKWECSQIHDFSISKKSKYLKIWSTNWGRIVMHANIPSFRWNVWGEIKFMRASKLLPITMLEKVRYEMNMMIAYNTLGFYIIQSCVGSSF